MLFYQYIYQLVIENDCVIIPNFGAFIANYSQANIDFLNKEFSPPKREVIFNENLKHNDSLLADYIANKRNISVEHANSLIQTFVDETKKLLKKDEVVKLYKLGNIKLQNDKIEFIINTKENINEDSYGLSNFVFPVLSNKTIVPQLEITQNPKNKRKLAWIIAPVAAATISGLLFFSYTNLINNNSNLNLSNLFSFGIFKPHLKTEETIKTDKIKVNTEIEIVNNEELIKDIFSQPNDENILANNNTLQEEKTISELQKEEIITPKVIAFAIAGCFINYNNAQKLNETLISKGYSSEILPLSKGLYRVSIKSYHTRQNAINDLETLKIQTQNNDIWVLWIE